jgi:hypothetical protein
MTTLDDFRSEIGQWPGLAPTSDTVDSTTDQVVRHDGFERRRIVDGSPDGDRIPAFQLAPLGGDGPGPAVLIHHQHNGERHLGRSEVCGLAGNPCRYSELRSPNADLRCSLPIPSASRIAGMVMWVSIRIRATGSSTTNDITYRLLRGDT